MVYGNRRYSQIYDHSKVVWQPFEVLVVLLKLLDNRKIFHDLQDVSNIYHSLQPEQII